MKRKQSSGGRALQQKTARPMPVKHAFPVGGIAGHQYDYSVVSKGAELGNEVIFKGTKDQIM